jgi:hypothetical protein
MRRGARSLKRSWRVDTLSKRSHQGSLAYRQPLSPTGRHRTPVSRNNAQEHSNKMGKFFLLAAAALLVILLGGAGVLMFWDVPAPSTPVEHAIPDAKLPK